MSKKIAKIKLLSGTTLSEIEYILGSLNFGEFTTRTNFQRGELYVEKSQEANDE